jgi:glutamate-ammonia-ligase adenylyltransferase
MSGGLPGTAQPLSALDHLQQFIAPDLRQGLKILLSQSADPQSAIRRLEVFCERRAAEFQLLAYTPFGLQALVAVFSSSNFLSDELMEHPDWLVSTVRDGTLHRVRSADELAVELEGLIGAHPGGEDALTLAAFRRWQILRVLLRDVLGFGALPEVTEELSNIADVLIDAALKRVKTRLVSRHGRPRLEDGAESGFTVFALGKLGGRELNYSSDIDLMFVYEGPGETDGAEPISNKEFFKKLSNGLTSLLGTYTAEGMIYRVDLRLRPDGRLGEVCISLEGALDYYERRARDWELQMLIKARVAAGDRAPGRLLLERVQPRIYSTSTDFSAIESMSETRERINEKMGARRRQAGLDVKLARGGIRDIEFLVQCLQRVHGGREAWLRNSSTLLALNRLRDKDLLSGSEYSRLVGAYQFLRHLEHRLQFADDRQTHLLPEDKDALAVVARRMPAALIGDDARGENLLSILKSHLEQVQAIYERIIHAHQMASPAQVVEPGAAEGPVTPLELSAPVADAPVSNLMRFLEQKAPGLAQAVARARLGRTQAAFEHFLERAIKKEEWIRALNSDAVLCGYLLEIFQNSPYFADQLMRQPEYVEEIRSLRARGISTTAYGEVLPLLEDVQEIRRFYLRQVFRLQAESICLRAPIFQTLKRMSELADAAIAAAYRLAVSQVFEARPPSGEEYVPAGQMMVIALGRLGMQEFDLGSDADLVFVLPDADGGEMHFWTRVAEKLIAIVSSYTGDGTMFSVDTRLCPNGRGGALVQLESTYQEYFAKQAEAWEGVAYMKSRAVAGNTERATEFLAGLQKIDWRRYGQSGRSREQVRQMRMRIEKEHGEGNPLKTASGGYYDIDFSLMYLRLKGAGMFFKVLNTPERIEVVEQMGHIDQNEARFLLDAATFYRAVDHGLRIISGHTEGSLPAPGSQLQLLTKLVERWVPEHLCDQPLAMELRQIQDRTRAYFERLFGE